MKSKNQIIKIIILAAVLALLLNPAILPFSRRTTAAIKSEMAANIGSLAGGRVGTLSTARVLSALAAVVIVWLFGAVVTLLFDNIKFKKSRSLTVAGLVRSVIKYACVLVAIVWSLGILGVNIAGIFASLGIITLIIGFGAQSLIEDMVTGIFIIFEGNYNIDDVIILDDFRGTVKKIGIRTTTIEDTGGNLKIVNNSDIRNIQNRSKNLSLAICDMDTPYEMDIRDVEKAILPELEGIYERNKDILKSVPRYMGVQELGDSSVVIRISALVNERNYFVAQRVLNREMKIIFDEKGIEIPFNQLEVHTK